MKKKLLTILLSVFMIMGTFTTRVFAEWTGNGNGTQGDPWKIGATGNEANVIAYKDGTTLHIEGSGDMQDFDFTPWGVDNTITAIDIGSGITNIGVYCFNSLFSITEVDIPYGVTKIGARAFNGCINLEEITFPETVTDIGEYAFCSVKDSAKIIIKATTPPTLSNEIVYYDGHTKCYVYVPSSSIKEYNNNTSWKEFYLFNASNNFIKPIVSNINDALGFADGGFPLSSESAPSNAWISANGAKVYKTTSAIVFEKGSDNLTFDLDSAVVEGDEKYTYSSGGTSLEFNVSDDYSFTSIILTNTSSDLDGTYYDSTSIAAALTKANGGFPTTSTNAWFNDNDICIYESDNMFCFDFGEDNKTPLCDISEKLDNENKYIFEEIVTIKFNIVDNKLSSITISGMPDPYNAVNGTYAAPVTIAGILATVPGGFPTTETSGWVKDNNSTSNRIYKDGNNLIIGTSPFSLNGVVTKEGNNYKHTSGMVFINFIMESNVLKKINFTVMSATASGDYVPYKYEIEPTESKPQGYTGTLVFETNGQYTNDSDVVVKVDGTPLTLNTDYQVEHGSIKVTLLGSYIKNLAPKTYTISIGVPGLYDEITSQFTITAAPSPSSDQTPRYKVPNTGVEGTYSNNHSLLKLSSLSLLAVGTYLVIKKKKDND